MIVPKLYPVLLKRKDLPLPSLAVIQIDLRHYELIVFSLGLHNNHSVWIHGTASSNQGILAVFHTALCNIEPPTSILATARLYVELLMEQSLLFCHFWNPDLVIGLNEA